jgi:hypothetical protein
LESHVDAQQLAVGESITLGTQLRECPDTARTPAALTRAVIWYTEKWADDPFQTVRYRDNAAIELRFELPIPTTEWRLSGRIDRFAAWQDDLYVVDTKTTKRILNAKYWEQWNPSVQFSGYRWAARALGLEIKGVLVEACQTMATGCRWQRHRLEIKDVHLDEFERDMVYYVRQAEQYHDTSHWPRNRSSCTLYGGCRLRDVCLASPARRRTYLEDKFVMVPYEAPRR